LAVQNSRTLFLNWTIQLIREIV